jgi:hypothetical protein
VQETTFAAFFSVHLLGKEEVKRQVQRVVASLVLAASSLSHLQEAALV